MLAVRSVVFMVPFVLCVCAHATPVQVTLKTEVDFLILAKDRNFRRPILKLSDVAEIAGGNLETRRTIANVDIAQQTQKPTTRLTKSLITLRLRLDGIDANEFVLAGADETIVRWQIKKTVDNGQHTGLHEPKRHDLLNSDQAVVDMARQALAEAWQVAPVDVEVRITRPLTGKVKDLLATTPGASLRPFSSSNMLPGAIRLAFGIYDGPTLLERSVAHLDGILMRRVAVAKRQILSRTTISAEDVEFVRRPVRGQLSRQATVEVIGKLATHSVPKGTILKTTDVRERAAANEKVAVVVRRGDLVRLVAKGRGLTVSVRTCEALENGKHGQLIRVRNMSSKKTVAGRVVGVGEVEISL